MRLGLRLFGTFQEEREDQPCIYGIRGPLHTFSPLWANLHIYVGMAQDAWRAARWRDKLWVLFAHTGWRPTDVAERYPREKTDLNDFHKYDPPVNRPVKAYALAQLVVTMAVGIALLFIPGLSWATNAAVVALMLLTMVCTGRWLDGRRVLNLEFARLVLTAAAAWLGWQLGFGLLLAVSVTAYALLNLLLLPLLSSAADVARLAKAPRTA